MSDPMEVLNAKFAEVEAEIAYEDTRLNEVMVAGAVLACLLGNDQVRAEPVTIDGQATNELYAWFDFMKSRYRITVTFDAV